MSETTFITVIPEDVNVDIQISGFFHKKLANLALALGESRPIEDYRKALETLKDREPEDLYELTVYAVVAILFEVETKAKEQKKTKMIEIDENNNVIPPSPTVNP